MTCVALVGFMGAGKTTVGRELATRLRWRFDDLDDLIQAVEGNTIQHIFETRGEPAFREMERRILSATLANHTSPRVLALGGGWWLMRKALAPVAALTQAAERITEHNLGERLQRTGNGDELDRLTEVFNAMTERLERSFTKMREFTLHASHELKTPLTVIHGELETALQETALDQARRSRLESELDEIQRLTKIVDGLTLLTKAGAGQITLTRESVSVTLPPTRCERCSRRR